MDFVHLAASFPFDWAHTLGSPFYCSAFRLVPRRWISARLQLLSVLQHHANHSRGKNDGRGKKIWFGRNLATCCGSSQVSYCAPRADLASRFFSLHLHESPQCMCDCVCFYTYGLWPHWHSVCLSLFCARAEVTYNRSYNLILSFFSLPT